MSGRFKIVVCRGPECGDHRGSRAVHDALEREVARRGLGGSVEFAWHSCFGRCTQGPNVLISELKSGPPPERRFAFATLPAERTGRSALYNGCSPGDAADLIEQHVVRGVPVRRLILPIAPSARRTVASAEPAPRLPDPDPDPKSDGEG